MEPMSCCADGRHSIIIPHRDRFETLAVCLWSIHHSASICGVKDYEILVVDNGSQFLPEGFYRRATWVLDFSEMQEFNKPALQNKGIERATGDVLTFLDADAVVGPRFMDNPALLRVSPEITKFCYRVRLLPAEQIERCGHEPTEVLHREWFAEYDRWPRAFEAYNKPYPDTPAGSEGGLLFANSHFSICRDTLGDLRYDEGFAGHGYEDLVFNWWLHKQRPDYNPALVADAPHAVLCFQHLYDDNRWLSGTINARNEKMYLDTIAGRRKYGGMECPTCK
jgi:hypothetical protein